MKRSDKALTSELEGQVGGNRLVDRALTHAWDVLNGTLDENERRRLEGIASGLSIMAAMAAAPESNGADFSPKELDRQMAILDGRDPDQETQLFKVELTLSVPADLELDTQDVRGKVIDAVEDQGLAVIDADCGTWD